MDTIANMIQQIRSAKAVGKAATVPFAKIKLPILEILKLEGYIKNYEVSKTKPPTIKVLPGGKGFSKISRLSSPGRRLYGKAKDLKIMPGRLIILSTPAGVMSAQMARKKNVGGELLLEVIS